MIRIGMRFRVKPAFAKQEGINADSKIQTGRVVYIHPKGKFAVLEFDGVFGNPRESFPLAQLTESNLVRKKRRH